MSDLEDRRLQAADPAWPVVKLKFLSRLQGGGTPSKEREEFWLGGDVPWVSPKDMKVRDLVETEDYITRDAVFQSATSFVAAGSPMIVARSGILRHTIPVAIARTEVTLNQDMKAFRTGPSLNAEFLSYWIDGQNKDLLLEWRQFGATVESLNTDRMMNSRIALPDLPTQKRIAAFLDRETARIDDLIAKKERFVEVQRKRLQSKLQIMVLGGANVRRGLEGDWLQNLPQGWRLMPLKHLVSVIGGATPSKDREEFWSGDIPWVSPKDMKVDIIHDVPDHVSEEAIRGSALQMIPEQAVLIVVRGMILTRMVPVCRLGVPATINQDMKALLPSKRIIRGDYLQRMLQGFGDVLMSFVEEAAHGAKKLRSEALFGLRFPVPPLDIQQMIAIEHDQAQVLTDRLNAANVASIDRLREYRAALITAAVTGQIDVDAYGKTGAASATLERIEEELQA